MLHSFKKITDRIFNEPHLYHGLRTAFLGGLPTLHILRLLEPVASDVILDIGCGTGFLAEKIPFRHYLGFDSDPRVIEIAQRKKIPNATFSVGQVQDFDFSKIYPTKAVLYGILHHLSDEDAVSLLRALGKTGVKWLVTLDPVYSKFHLLNNLLCKLDRGGNVRDAQGMQRLIEQSGLRIETMQIHNSNTAITKYINFRLTP